MTERDVQGGDRETARCHMCDETFPTQEELSRHLMDAHADDGFPTPDPNDREEPDS